MLEKTKENPRSKQSRQIKMEVEKKTTNSTNFIGQERDIHEAYQLILNAYYMKVKQRRKVMESANTVYTKVKKHPNVSDEKVKKNSNVLDEKDQGNSNFK